jgi:RimJ/RimL family protein N-acetyltransferase
VGAPDVSTEVAWPERVTLRDGSEMLVRPIEPRDKARLVHGFEALSPESRYRRFLTPMTSLRPKMLRYLTEVDHHDHEALVAASAENGEPVGVARYIRTADDPTAAEVAVAVVDRWQGRGAATELLRRLGERARAEGIERFTATCLAENRDVLELLEGIGAGRARRMEGGLVEVGVELPVAIGPGEALVAALRGAAAGHLSFRHPLEPADGEPSHGRTANNY